VERDARAIEALRALGWRVLVVWECAIRDKETLSILPETLADWIRSDAPLGEVVGDAMP
jgi:DNA mismatch endonuclease (patch repair protein)